MSLSQVFHHVEAGLAIEVKSIPTTISELEAFIQAEIHKFMVTYEAKPILSQEELGDLLKPNTQIQSGSVDLTAVNAQTSDVPQISTPVEPNEAEAAIQSPLTSNTEAV